MQIAFGALLQRRRNQRGLSLRQLAAKVNYSYGYVGRLERGQSVPQVDVATHLDRELGVDAGEPALAELAISETATAGRASGLRLAHPAQLPPIPSDALVRHAEWQALDAVLASERPGAARVCVLSGPPGIGKTTTAVQWAHSVAPRFPDGQVIINLHGWSRDAPRRPDDVLPRVLRALGVPSPVISTDLEDQVAMLRTVTADRRLLIVLDNAREIEQVLPLLPGAQCLVVVTSRRRLTGLVHEAGATLVPVAPLPATDALKLLSAHGDAVQDERAVKRVIFRCAGIPLALRSASEYLLQRPHQTLDDTADQLTMDRGTDLAGEDGISELHERVEWSLASLPESPRTLLLLLSLVPGTIDLRGAAALAHWPETATRQAADRLLDEHLLDEPRPGQIELNPVIRACAARRANVELPRLDREHAERRWLLWNLYSLAAAQQRRAPERDVPALPERDAAIGKLIPAFESPACAQDWICDQAVMLRGLMERARVLQQDDLAWRISACAADGLASTPYWGVRLSIHRAGVDAARRAQDLAGTAWSLHQLGETRARLRHWREARHHLNEALTLRQTLNDRRGSAQTRIVLGDMSLDMGRAETAWDEFDRAHDTLVEFDDTTAIAEALAGRGTAKRQLDDAIQARADLDGALRLVNEFRAPRAAAVILMRSAEVSVEMQELEKALHELDRALFLLAPLDDHREIADIWHVRGHALKAGGDVSAAVRAWERAAARYDHLGDPRAADARSRVAATAETNP